MGLLTTPDTRGGLRQCPSRFSAFSCKKHRQSFGVVLFHEVRSPAGSRGTRYYFICKRRDSFCYVDFLRGVAEKKHMRDYIRGMTAEEKRRLLDNDFDALWKDLWVHHEGKPYRKEKDFAKLRFENNMEQYAPEIEASLQDPQGSLPDAGWCFPKGHRHCNERELHCALREFYEESNYPTKPWELRLSKRAPCSSEHTSFNRVRFRSTYFIVLAPSMETPKHNIPETPLRRSCVSDEIEECAWVTADVARGLLPPYSASMLASLDAQLDTREPAPPRVLLPAEYYRKHSNARWRRVQRRAPPRWSSLPRPQEARPAS